ncbi:MAG TPA: DedA family protein [Rheinheimera sp.]|uniref:YqaA family protein n=1 Tax=Rheinheimera sp. TaxID=1869214 RepID=UPI000EBF2B28|nr:YqaA family protein [Rheinheimera sp.]HCU66689.1 DedA family protein [Rheinheimera sp.]
MNTAIWPWLGLLFSAFSSATVLPGSSEIVLGALWWQGYNPLMLWAIATFGNVTGSCLNWWLGSQLLRFSHKRWFPVDAEQLAKAERWYQRWGSASLLLSWVPVVGDPLTIVAGVMRMKLWLFVPLVLLAKGSRYALLLLLADQLLPKG